MQDQILEPTAAAAAATTTTTGTMSTLDNSGDSTITWTHGNDDETEAARILFNALKKKGHAAFKMDAGGHRGEQITEFDPRAHGIIMVPQIRGG